MLWLNYVRLQIVTCGSRKISFLESPALPHRTMGMSPEVVRHCSHTGLTQRTSCCPATESTHFSNNSAYICSHKTSWCNRNITLSCCDHFRNIYISGGSWSVVSHRALWELSEHCWVWSFLRRTCKHEKKPLFIALIQTQSGARNGQKRNCFIQIWMFHFHLNKMVNNTCLNVFSNGLKVAVGSFCLPPSSMFCECLPAVAVQGWVHCAGLAGPS